MSTDDEATPANTATVTRLKCTKAKEDVDGNYVKFKDYVLLEREVESMNEFLAGVLSLFMWEKGDPEEEKTYAVISVQTEEGGSYFNRAVWMGGKWLVSLSETETKEITGVDKWAPIKRPCTDDCACDE